MPDVLAAHNLNIMLLPAFKALFTILPLHTRYCDYLGSLDVRFMFRLGSCLVSRLQMRLDAFMIHVAGHRQLRNRHTSPHLLYVGTKRDIEASGVAPAG